MKTPNPPKTPNLPKTPGELYAAIRRAFPHGHWKFTELLLAEARLHSDKNHDYAKGGDPLGNFKRVAGIMQQYPGFPWASPVGTAVVQMLKQLDAALWMTAQRTEARVEGVAQRWMDVSVFAKLIPILQEDDANEAVHGA